MVPEVTTTALSFRSGKSLIGPPFFTSRRVPTTKMVSEKAACFWRSRLLVVEPHSKSKVPFCNNGIRFCEVTDQFDLQIGFVQFFLMASTMALE